MLEARSEGKGVAMEVTARGELKTIAFACERCDKVTFAQWVQWPDGWQQMPVEERCSQILCYEPDIPEGWGTTYSGATLCPGCYKEHRLDHSL